MADSKVCKDGLPHGLQYRVFLLLRRTLVCTVVSTRGWLSIQMTLEVF